MPLSSDGPNFKARPLATRSSDSITGLKKRRQDGNPYQKRFDEKELCKAFLGKEIVREKVFRQEILSEEVFRKEVFREEVLGEEVFREEIFGEGDGGEAGNEARREIARNRPVLESKVVGQDFGEELERTGCLIARDEEGHRPIFRDREIIS